MKRPRLDTLLRRAGLRARPAPPAPDALRHTFRCEGRDVVITLPPPGESDLPSTLAFSLHKSGSTLLQQILIDLAPHAGVSMCSLDSQFWDQGITPGQVPVEVSELFSARSYCYGVFRLFPWRYNIPFLGTAPKIFLVRDPRDAVVSHYFSIAKSHPTPEQAPDAVRERIASERARVGSSSIDDHVVEQAEFFRRVHWRYIRDLVRAHDVRVFRYEDVIFSKREWVDEICRAFSWDVPEGVRQQIADRHDTRPDREDASAHIRRVTPGDHREKLRPETIARLDEVFDPVLRQYGYERSTTPAGAG